MRAYVGVTDGGWAHFLSSRPDLREVNFWRPYGNRRFGALALGEVFLFKSRFPENQIVGGAVFEGFVSLNVQSAWDIFGEGNGVGSLDDFVARLCAITHEDPSGVPAKEIGCVLLRDTAFFSPSQRATAPATFPRNVMQGKRFAVDGSEPVIAAAVERVLGAAGVADSPVENLGPTRGAPRLVTPRLGQNGFKAVVLDAYGRRCAFTGHQIIPTLEAAHIIPVSEGGEHRVDNGLLLRSDVHTLFDRGYLSIDADAKLMVSARLRHEFGNGDEFYARAGRPIALPPTRAARPARGRLAWHRENVFR